MSMPDFSDSTACDAGVGKAHALHLADFGAAVGDIAACVKTSRLGQLDRDPVAPDAEQQHWQLDVAEEHNRAADQRDRDEDRQAGS